MATIGSSSSGTKQSKKDLKVLKHLESAIIEEGGEVKFECTTSTRPKSKCAWYKNGKKILTDQRVTITSIEYNSKIVHRLTMKQISSTDQGIYTITCITLFCSQTSSTANLLVANKNITNGVTYHHLNNKDVGVLEHVRSVKVKEGDNIELQATFLHDVIDYIWYKNNEQIAEDHRTIILNQKILTTLCIKNSKADDTGIYYVVAKAKEGTVSSFATVLVLPVKKVKTKDKFALPVIEDMPSQIEAFEREDVRVICRADYNLNTRVEWHGNGNTPIPSNFEAEEYGARCIGLRGVNLSLKDAGEYFITLRDEGNGHTVSSSCVLKITAAPKDYCPPQVELKTELTSAMACLGSRVMFRCQFDLEMTRFIYVVWYIGIYKIERTNCRFSVLYKGGDFFLYIKAIEPEMAGNVVCELREVLPDLTSVRVSSSTARLDIVPLCVVEEEKKTNTSCIESKIYDKNNPSVIKETKRESFFERMWHSLFSEDPKVQKGGKMEETVDIIFCLLDDDGVYFFQATKGSTDVSATVTFLTNSVDTIKIALQEKTFKSKSWCSVQFMQYYGSYIQSGISSTLSFQVKMPSRDVVLKIRVLPVPPPADSAESIVCIVPQQETHITPMKCTDLRPATDFNNDYQIKEVLGTGSFGRVELVRDVHGKYYAAKTIKLKSGRCLQTAKREYDIMAQLRHPKIILLTEGFFDTKQFIIVMDYLWGGDLFYRIAQEENIREEDVVFYVRQICEGLVYLHEKKIVHLDLKPENIVCYNPNSRLIKIIDFGIARLLTDEKDLKLVDGTKEYIAPEALNYETITVACDMWSLGVLTYIMLSGLWPFCEKTWSETTVKINKAEYDYCHDVFDNVSSVSKDFIDQLLVIDIKKRMTAAQASQHNWLKYGPPKDNVGCMRQTRENIKSYLAGSRRKWQRAGNVMIAARRLRVFNNSHHQTL